MATATAYANFNDIDPIAFHGVVMQATATSIVVSDGYQTGIYYGQGLTFSGGQLTGDLVTGYAAYIGNTLAGVFADFAIPAAAAQTLITSSDLPGLFRSLLGGADTIHGSAYADRIASYDGNDRIIGGAGNDYIDGGAGLDTAVYAGTGHYGVMRSGQSFLVMAPDGTDTLTNVERLEFADGRMALDIDGPNSAGAAYRIYQAAFDRTPDTGGLTYWTEQADTGMSTIEMSARFIDSDEFRALYGSSSPPADSLISQIYENVLHREADESGRDYWIGQLGSGMSEAEVLARFADSPENRANVIDIIGNGIWLNHEGDYTS